MTRILTNSTVQAGEDKPPAAVRLCYRWLCRRKQRKAMACLRLAEQKKPHSPRVSSPTGKHNGPTSDEQLKQGEVLPTPIAGECRSERAAAVCLHRPLKRTLQDPPSGTRTHTEKKMQWVESKLDKTGTTKWKKEQV